MLRIAPAAVSDVPPQSEPPLSPWRYLKRYRARVLLGVLALVATSGLALVIPWLLGRTVEALQGPAPGDTVPVLALAMVGFALGQALTRIVSRIQLFNSARLAEYDLRSDLFARLLQQAPSYYRHHTTGDVMSRLTSDVQTVRAMWGPGVLNIVNTTFTFTTALVLMLSIDVQLALVALLPYPLMVLFGRFFAGRLYRSNRAVQDYLGQVSAAIQEDLSGVGVIKNYTLEESRKRRFSGMADKLLSRNMEVVNVRGQLMPMLSGLASLGTVAVIYVGGGGVVGGRLTLGELVQFNAYLALLVWPTLALGWMLSLFQRGLASWKRLVTILDAEPTIMSPPAEQAVNVPRAQIRGDVEIRDLTIEFDGRTILDSVSLTAPAGSVTALVGRTGSGKSTLVEALPRLLELPRGSVLLDGTDVLDLPLETLRTAIGYAPQESFLFSNSIGENIAFGIEHTAEESMTSNIDAHRTEIDRATDAAGLESDLAALPDSLDTVVGERGIALSGGQRQRVALARAIASSPRVLILDDSLSSVDTETERTILSHLAEVMKGRTTFLISHRIAAIKAADQILVLDGGKVVEVGLHDELLAKNGVYAELYRDEFAADEADEAAHDAAHDFEGVADAKETAP